VPIVPFSGAKLAPLVFAFDARANNRYNDRKDAICIVDFASVQFREKVYLEDGSMLNEDSNRS
jgi:hypothetical protein